VSDFFPLLARYCFFFLGMGGPSQWQPYLQENVSNDRTSWCDNLAIYMQVLC
jgi:hypothetical protein